MKCVKFAFLLGIMLLCDIVNSVNKIKRLLRKYGESKSEWRVSFWRQYISVNASVCTYKARNQYARMRIRKISKAKDKQGWYPYTDAGAFKYTENRMPQDA